jgi:phosphoglycolate phosphatase-like HAD superfamily hydrolase
MGNSVKCLVFDFDGVLVDSNAVKRGAYFDALRPLGAPPALVERVLDDNRHGDRYDVIRAVIRSLPGGETARDEAERLVEECAERYNAICEGFTATCPEMEGASGTLVRLSARYALYVNSATPESPLRRVVERRGWGAYFRGVLGRPRTKEQNLRDIIAREGLEPSEVIMIGDGIGDRDAARACGCAFVGFRGEEFHPREVVVVKALGELDRVIDALGGRGLDAWR